MRRLLDDLCAIHDTVWFDSEPLATSGYVQDEFEEALRKCPSLFIVVTPESKREHSLDPEFDYKLNQWLRFLASRGVPCIQSDTPPTRYSLPDDSAREYHSLLRMLQARDKELDIELNQLSLSPPYASPSDDITTEEPSPDSTDQWSELYPDLNERPGLSRQSLERYRQTLLEEQDANTARQISIIGQEIQSCRHTLRLSRAELAGQLEIEVEVLVTIENGCGDLLTAFWLLESVQQLQADIQEISAPKGDRLVSGH